MSRKRRKMKSGAKKFSVICLILALLICLVAYLPKNISFKKITNKITENGNKKEEKPKKVVQKVSVVATGDALIHSGVFNDAYDPSTKDYDFSKQFEYVAPIVKQYDIAYYNQETVFGGKTPSNYPMFCTPDHLGIDMQEAGFNMVSMATNHSMDTWGDGALHAIKFWKEQKDVLTAGMYESQEDHDEVRVFEKNGITYTMLSYTYGTNGLPVPNGQEYLVNVWPTDLYINDPARDNNYQAYKEVVKADIERVRDKVDVLFVAMHWGIEYTHTPTRYEEDMAKFLADNGVDVVIGAHPHVIQPISKIGDTLVIYSLGNFISAQDGENRLIGMLVSFDITKTTENDQSTIVVDNVGVDLTWNYRNLYYRDFKVIPFSVMDDKYLRNSEDVYNRYKAIVDKPYSSDYIEGYDTNFEINVKGYKSGLTTEEGS